MELRFKLSERDNDVEYLARRIAGLISSDTTEAPKVGLKHGQENIYSLGGSNDWWLRYYPREQEISVSYRYAGGHSLRMEALAEFIVRFMELGWINRPVTPIQRIREIIGGDLALGKKQVLITPGTAAMKSSTLSMM